MNMLDIAVPQVYKDSQDFRFFMQWFATALSKTQYDIENIFDLYDPLRCREDILWLLGDTMGYKYDDRMSTAFNRLVLIYFMSMIYNRGSKNGMTLAAETNLAQFPLKAKADDDDIYFDRLEDTSIPVNSVYVNPHPADGYIDVVYFSSEIPVDACIEYVRPLGMFCFQRAGVKADADTKIMIDARLTDIKDIGMSFGPTQVGHYRREDYARMQKTVTPTENDTSFTRQPVWNRNSKYEGSPNPDINPGYRALYSLQISNNEQVVSALLDPIFSLGYGPQDVGVTYPDGYLRSGADAREWNLRYDSTTDASIEPNGVTTIDPERSPSVVEPRPAVNPIMAQLGDAMAGDEPSS